MTVTLLALDEDGTVVYSGLHRDILVFRNGQDKVESFETRGIWLGMVEDIDGLNKMDSFVLAVGDTMLLYTDGTVEAIDADGKLYGSKRLIEVFETCGLLATTDIRNTILDSLEGYDTKDDITLLLVKKEK